MNCHSTSQAFTLITGASEGIGRAMAESCAKRGLNLVLVALPDQQLALTGHYLVKKYNVRAYTLGIDLTSEYACEKIVEWLHGNQIQIDKLINNAGIGSSGYFEAISAEQYLKQMRLNVIATAMLTRLLIDDLKANQPSGILNVGSLAGFFCIPYKSLYSATKSFVIFFSRSLREELASSGVNVSVLCPGPVATNAEVLKRALKHGWIARKAIMSAEEVAEVAINGFLRRKAIIIPGRINRALFFINRFLPHALSIRLVKNEFKKELATTFPTRKIHTSLRISL